MWLSVSIAITSTIGIVLMVVVLRVMALCVLLMLNESSPRFPVAFLTIVQYFRETFKHVFRITTVGQSIGCVAEGRKAALGQGKVVKQLAICAHIKPGS